MMISLAQGFLGVGSGSLVGFSLGLVGGGGSILAVPLMVYLVGVPNPHIAIGTSAVAVAANAAANLLGHARRGSVKWPCAFTFAGAGVTGAYLGSLAGKMVDGQKLLALFAVLMMIVAVLMLRGRAGEGDAKVRLGRDNLLALVGLGLASGALSGFFGIGGGFLIVPALMLATGMPILNAVGSSLLAVTAFGLTTAASYAFSGLVDWTLAAIFIAGGVMGGLAGGKLATLLAAKRGALNGVFAAVIFAVAIYMLVRVATA
jgi:uncharacterized membrane protein YfcA